LADQIRDLYQRGIAARRGHPEDVRAAEAPKLKQLSNAPAGTKVTSSAPAARDGAGRQARRKVCKAMKGLIEEEKNITTGGAR